jgi:hypothetical protein
VQYQQASQNLVAVQKAALGILFRAVLQSPRDVVSFEHNPLDSGTWILLSRFYYTKKDLKECLELQCVDESLTEQELSALQGYNNALQRFHRAKKQLKSADELRKKNPYIVDEEGSVRLVIENEGALFWFDGDGCIHIADGISIYL